MKTQKRIHEVAQPIFVSEVYIVHDNKLLMFKRSETKKKFPGFWSLPGGHIDEGEDPLAAAIREVQEETGVIITPEDIKLKVVAMHHHLDREEMYIAFAFSVGLKESPMLNTGVDEGKAHWIEIDKAKTLENVFEPVKYYFNHVLNNKPGIIYNTSQWENTKLVRVLSETIDKNS
ncbi:MAG: NUDIX domain-containing protein [Candidatus Pacebacteria bacterium]|jgi:8-oxo-dGTP pyrophosphatase MutT (NUDIX family)|nr:NUDIX domain-containing protein [Candidatus Paceibacterota bacterium]MBT3511741.1 NUDIX domain-containing protein [Candidatus Paceibacterota bacterium]MBT4004806.1 NUDIX domain-containing protein [Candidatus Paceibacterota bacterium]MBT4358487.1 NUDIX domain-containing protein [Candidatus Paceibacterota bacterium]MBT4680617.1 NUDIX domain-containing protein [Candidatus Paceibacterota bacterium]